MEKEKKEKKNSKDGVLAVFLVLVVMLGFICGFELSSEFSERLDHINNKKTTTKESSDIMSAGKNGKNILGFDEKYVDSDDIYDYYLDFGTYAGSGDSYFTLKHGTTKNELLVTKYSYDNEETQEYSLAFAANVVDVRLGHFDNNPIYSALFFLLDNGDVCYSFVDDMASDSQYGFYTTIEELSNIVKFYNGKKCDAETGVCYTTTFAQATDGTTYDLVNYVK